MTPRMMIRSPVKGKPFSFMEKSFEFNSIGIDVVPALLSTMLLLAVFAVCAHLASAAPLQHAQVRLLAHLKASLRIVRVREREGARSQMQLP